MSGGAVPAPKRGKRRPPEEARQEILDATAVLLTERPFRELTVAEIMNRTQIGRSAFYAYFKDIYAVVEELLMDIRDEVLVFLKAWESQQLESRAALREVLRNTVDLWVGRGPMISAMLDAAASDRRLEAAFTEIATAYSEAVATSLLRDQAAGRTRATLDCDEVAEMLVIGTQAYLKEKLGRATGRSNVPDMTAALQDIWEHALYGRLDPAADDVAAR